MRKITKESSEAFVNFKSYKKGNTEVSSYEVYESDLLCSQERTSRFYLHGNLIARMTKQIGSRYPEGLESIKIDLCGWHTPTTRERINGILDALGYDFRIAQRNHEQVLVKRVPNFIFNPDGESSKTYSQDILKLSDDSFDPDFAEKVFLSSEFVSGTDLNAIADF